MIRLVSVLTLFISVLSHGQNVLSKKIAPQLKPLIIPKNHWNDTILGWSTVYQYHERKNIAMYYQCSGSNHLYKYVVKEKKNGMFQLDRKIYLDSNGHCYENVDSIQMLSDQLSTQIDYSVVYDSSFNISLINFHPPIILNSEQLLAEAHENYIWEDMQFGKWLIDTKKSIIHGKEIPPQNYHLSPKTKAFLDSINLKEDSIRQFNNQLFLEKNKIEFEQCLSLYKRGSINDIKNCDECIRTLLSNHNNIDTLQKTLFKIESEWSSLRSKFDELIAKADEAFFNSSWELAKEYYLKAKEIQPEHEYPNKQLEKIKQLTKPKRH